MSSKSNLELVDGFRNLWKIGTVEVRLSDEDRNLLRQILQAVQPPETPKRLQEPAADQRRTK